MLRQSQHKNIMNFVKEKFQSTRMILSSTSNSWNLSLAKCINERTQGLRPWVLEDTRLTFLIFSLVNSYLISQQEEITLQKDSLCQFLKNHPMQ
jgi:hypothetical protein